MAISVVDALNNSGVGKNWLSGNVDTTYDTQKVQPVKAPGFVGGLLSGVGHVASAVGGAVVHTIASPVQAGIHMVQGTQRNLGLDNKEASLEKQRKALDEQNSASVQRYRATGDKATYLADTRRLKDAYLALSSGAKDIQAAHYGAGQVASDYGKVAAGVLSLAAPVLKPLEAGADATGLLASGAKAVNASVGAGKALGATTIPTALKAGGGMLLRNGINQQTADVAGTTATDLQSGNYQGALGNAALLAAPLGIAAVAKAAPIIGKTLSEAMYGRQGFFDAVVKSGGPDMLSHLDGLTGAAQKKLSGLLRQVQQYNLDQYDGDSRAAGAHFVKYLEDQGRSPQAMDAATLTKELGTWVKANLNANKLASQGRMFLDETGKAIKLKPGQRIIAARFDQSVYGPLKAQFAEAGSPAGRLAIIQAQVKAGADWTKNPNLLAKVSEIAGKDGEWEKDFGKIVRSRSLFTSPVKNLSETERKVFNGGKPNEMPAGYFPAISSSARADFKTVAKTGEIDRGKAANRVLGVVGNAVKKVGLDTQSADPTANARFTARLNSKLDAVKVANETPQSIRSQLRDATESMKGISDERQFSVEQIKGVLKVSHDEAVAIKKAYTSAYSGASLADIGVSGKVENALYKIPGYGTYRRIQGVGRYELNPFFRVQERAETEVLAQVVSGGKSLEAPGTQMINRIFGGKNADSIDKTVNVLKENDIFAGSGFGGAGANENSFSSISARLSRGQQRSVAGLVNTMADKAGKSVEGFVSGMDTKTLDSIRSIVQYPSKGFTSSNFAKTMNLLVFPSRYNVKLATVLGKALAKAPATTQIATLKGAADLHTFLGSDEGKKWQSDNSEVLGIIAYLNPLNNLSGTFKLLSGQSADVSDFGTIGGLPLGVISQLLQDEGVTPKLGSAYLNPKTGEVVPDKLPASTAGAAKVAMTDLINSMYSFPGRTFGTSYSKSQLTQGLPGLKLNSGDTTPAPARSLTKEQVQEQRVLAPNRKTKAATPMPTTGPTGKLTLSAPKITPSVRKVKRKAVGSHSGPI